MWKHSPWFWVRGWLGLDLVRSGDGAEVAEGGHALLRAWGVCLDGGSRGGTVPAWVAGAALVVGAILGFLTSSLIFFVYVVLCNCPRRDDPATSRPRTKGGAPADDHGSVPTRGPAADPGARPHGGSRSEHSSAGRIGGRSVDPGEVRGLPDLPRELSSPTWIPGSPHVHPDAG